MKRRWAHVLVVELDASGGLLLAVRAEPMGYLELEVVKQGWGGIEPPPLAVLVPDGLAPGALAE